MDSFMGVHLVADELAARPHTFGIPYRLRKVRFGFADFGFLAEHEPVVQLSP
jgi:hypothetical protein